MKKPIAAQGHMRHKTIAIVVNTTWNIYNFRLNIIKKLLKENYRIFVVAPVDKYIHYKEQFPELIHIPLHRLHRKSTNPIKDLSLMLELIGIYRRIKPDIVLHYTVKPNIYGGIAAGVLKIPSIAVVTGLGYAFIHSGLLQKLTKILYRFSSYFHRRFIFENEDDLHLFRQLKMIKEDQGISIKGCGVDASYFTPLNGNRRNGRTVFTFIGRLIYDKGITEFVEAARSIKERFDNTSFWIIGEIDKGNPAAIREHDLINWVKEKTVIYHGPKDDIKEYIGSSSCVVLPSYREGLPKVLLESMAMAKPVITTNTPGCREAVDNDYNGFLVPPKDSKSLARTMERFLELDQNIIEEMGKNGRKKVLSEFEDHIIAGQLFEIIEHAM